MAAACSWEARDAATNMTAMSVGWYIREGRLRGRYSPNHPGLVPFLGFTLNPYPKS